MSRRTLVECSTLAILGILLTFGALVDCGGPENKECNIAQSTPAQSAQEASTADTPNAAQTPTAEIDEVSIRESLSHLTGASAVLLSGGHATVTDRSNEEGRRAAIQYMKESFQHIGLPARILDSLPRVTGAGSRGGDAGRGSIVQNSPTSASAPC